MLGIDKRPGVRESTWTVSRRLGLVPLTGAITRVPEQLARQKAPSGLSRRLPDWVLDSNRRSKVDSSLTDRLGGESKCELSGAGWRADLYSAFGVQRKMGHLLSSKLIKCFSATGRRGGFVKITAKRRDFGLLTSYFSDNNDLLAEGKGFEPRVRFPVRRFSKPTERQTVQPQATHNR